MNLEHKKLAEKVIDFFKKSNKSKLSPGRDLLHLLSDNNTAEIVIYSLEKDFGLIERSGKESFRLTDKGWGFTTFKKLEKDSKKTPLNTYQKIYLSFFILFGAFGIYKVFQPTVSVSDFHKLNTDFNSLSSRFDSIIKLISKPTSPQLNDTLQINDFGDLRK